MKQALSHGNDQLTDTVGHAMSGLEEQTLTHFGKVDTVIASIGPVLLISHFSVGQLLNNGIDDHLLGIVVDVAASIEYVEGDSIQGRFQKVIKNQYLKKQHFLPKLAPK